MSVTFGIWYLYRHNIHELLVAVHLTPVLQRVPRQGLEPRTYFFRDQVTPLRTIALLQETRTR